jgi:hypothetical protein
MTTPYIEAKKAEITSKIATRLDKKWDRHVDKGVTIGEHRYASNFMKQEVFPELAEFLESFLSEIEGRVTPEEMTMEAALKSGSDAGAGYTIGHNYCRKEILDNFQHLRTGVTE